MICSECQAQPKAQRPLYSYLNRDLALRLTCRAIADRIRSDGNLVERIVTHCRDAVANPELDGSEKHIAACRSRLESLDRRIQFILTHPGETDVDQAESTDALKTLRAERARLRSEIATAEVHAQQPRRAPTEEQVRSMIEELDRVLLEAAQGKEPKDAGMFREILELLTGGRIDLEQLGERKAQRGWLRGRFTLGVELWILKQTESRVELTVDSDNEVIIDYRETMIAETHIERAKALYDAGMLVTAIALELGIDRHQVTDALRIWNQRHNMAPPVDGRRRRASVQSKNLEPPVFQKIAEEAKSLLDQGLLVSDIVERLKRDSATVCSALRHWYESRGLPKPDFRHRRKELSLKNRKHSQ